ncbi:MAG TPA: response regulator [Chloroflexota bacterium]|jgi:CheY-like chemotaxis protein|nr:response regulator [Chloroflexota bacterium]
MGQRILVVDDDNSNLELARKILGASGYDVLLARDGYEAVKVAVTALPDLILMDLSLPGLDGWEAVQQIRSRLAQAIPIVALTAHAMAGDREQALATGCNDYLAKPYKPVDLRAKISSLLPTRV